MLLGSGELGKAVVIALQRLGQHVMAVDAYPGARVRSQKWSRQALKNALAQ